MGRVPKRERLTKALNQIRTNNVMGARGENTITFSEGLIFDNDFIVTSTLSDQSVDKVKDKIK